MESSTGLQEDNKTTAVDSATGIQSPDQSVIDEVLKERPGLSPALKGLTLIQETPSRRDARLKYGLEGHSETWLHGDEGDGTYLHPNKGQGNYIEFFDKLNRDEQKNAVIGEAFHLMHNDFEYQKLWNEFKNSYSPEESTRMAMGRGAFLDANSPGANDYAKHDAYVRAFFNEPDVMKWQKQSGNTMYSPHQMVILNKMSNYINGKPNNEETL
jgi:hypothetical protein